MYSIVLEHQRGLVWSSCAVLRAAGAIRRIAHRNLQIVCVWPLLMRSSSHDMGYFMTAGGN